MDSQAAPALVPSEENILWKGHSSHIINLPSFIVCGLAIGILLGAAIAFREKLTQTFSLAVAALSLVPLSIIIGKWSRNRCRQYEITTERIHLRQGVIARQTDDLELYRVKDYTLDEPFFLRMFGLGNIVLTTTDDKESVKVIQAVPQVQALRDQIRKHVEICRTRKGVRIAEIE